ncbi:ABC transporter ATP-binding protein [Angustibacter sp. Root456]|uniref:ABC transporter ATP-binding protein n=1 Tax=Angustibacter sp. Root456 TaxID=1736539 RepID=UPI0006FF84DC|nr:ABC transporter ATP-binding protein [Angustibacter sp. Root456]KQX61684.1 multidrug ABC transporter ATP-binding protein [Angustibacter sp. Root456]
MLISILRTYLRPYRRALLGVVGLQLVGTIASLYLPSLNARIIDQGIARGDSGYIVRTGGWMLGVSLVQIACTIAAVYLGARTAMAFGRDVRSGVFARVGTFSAREVNQFGAPSLITRNTNDVQQVQMLVLMTCTMMIAAPIMCVGGIVMALREDVGLSWLMVVAIPVLVVAIGSIVRQMVPGFRLMQKRIDEVNRVLREQITGVRVVRAFVREPHETQRFERANTDLTDVALRVGRLMILIFPTVMLILNASSVAVLWFGGHRVDEGAMQVGSLTAFLQYLMQILMSVMMATFMAIMVPRASVCADRIGEVMGTSSSVVPPSQPVRETTAPASVELRDAGFTYPGADSPVLEGISFTAQPGQVTAVIGSTGSGKTTLLGLVARLIDPTVGSVRIADVDVRDLDPELLWHRIGLVPQRPYLFSGTVASNLRYGNPDASDDELWAALDVAQASDFVREAGGLEAPIAQGGTNVSGGQRQRLCIARALVVRPDVYLFDDAFSALDLATDARLRRALQPITGEATVIVVAQRVSTIIDADQVVVLDSGRVVGIGRHDELLETCPTYAEIVESQAAAQEAA